MLTPVPNPITVGGSLIGTVEGPFTLIAGPCVVESRDLVLRTAEALAAISERVGLPLIFKASFDKANRSAIDSFRGPGLQEGLAVLDAVRREVGLRLTTDVHLPEQCGAVGEVVDILQVPAFLCRQTDLLVAAAATGKPVNVKKGQFLAPWDMGNVVGKLRASDASGVMLTERGSSFGYNNLVSDMRSLVAMRALGVPVCFDATHSVQLPGGRGATSGGQREYAPALARAALSVGVDAVFMEVHPAPEEALSDGPNMIPLSEVEALLERLAAFDGLARS